MRDSAKDKDCLPYENVRNANAIFHLNASRFARFKQTGERFAGFRSFAKKMHRKKKSVYYLCVYGLFLVSR